MLIQKQFNFKYKLTLRCPQTAASGNLLGFSYHLIEDKLRANGLYEMRT